MKVYIKYFSNDLLKDFCIESRTYETDFIEADFERLKIEVEPQIFHEYFFKQIVSFQIIK